MDKLLEFVANNPPLVVAIIIIIAVLTLAIVFLILVAAIQGREVTLWPPKIGPRTEQSQSLPKGASGQPSFLKSIALTDREGFPLPFIKRLEQAREVWLLGINIDGLISQYSSFLTSKAQNGCKFRILVVDPKFFITDDLSVTSWPVGTRSMQDLDHSIKIMEKMIETIGNKNFELSFISFPPPFSLMAINPGSDDQGECQIELYSYQPATHIRPHFILTPKISKYWFAYFINEFELAWKSSRKFDRRKDLKPVTEKSGVILYRKSDKNNLEFLLISSRLNPKTWVFPGGVVEKGETSENAAVRECQEESGYIPGVISKVGSLEINKIETLEIITFFLATIAGESSEYEKDRQKMWVSAAEMGEMVVEDFKPVAMTAVQKVISIESKFLPG